MKICNYAMNYILFVFSVPSVVKILTTDHTEDTEMKQNVAKTAYSDEKLLSLI